MSLILSFLILIGSTLLELGSWSNDSLVNYCGLDIMVKLAGPLTFLFIIIFPISIQNHYVTKRSFIYQFVIRRKSWRAILLAQIKKSAIFSFLNTAILILISLLFAYVYGIPLYNWDSYNSLFYIYEGQCLLLNCFQVYLYAIVCIFVRCVILHNILILSSWKFRYKIIGNFIILCIILDEALRGHKFICRLIPFNYNIWCNPDDRFQMVIQCIVYLCVAVFIYSCLISRKEILKIE